MLGLLAESTRALGSPRAALTPGISGAPSKSDAIRPVPAGTPGPAPRPPSSGPGTPPAAFVPVARISNGPAAVPQAPGSGAPPAAPPTRTAPVPGLRPAAVPPTARGPVPARSTPRPAPPAAAASPWTRLRRSRAAIALKRFLPPVRLVWIFLLVILWNGHAFLGTKTAVPLLMLPLVGVLTDLGFQAVRFPKLRVPDAAVANGLFLSVILWPSQISLALVAVVVVTIGLRHAVRVGGHPVFNPAAAGVLVAATVFALPQPWHVGSTLSDTLLVAALGLVLWSRALPTWRIWGPYFACNLAAVAMLADALGGARSIPLVLQASALGATPVFFGMFMVTEPRTAPTNRSAMILFGTIVGFAAALLPVVFAESSTISALGVLAPYLALFVGNVVTIALPSARGVQRPTATPSAAPPARPSGANREPT